MRLLKTHGSLIVKSQQNITELTTRPASIQSNEELYVNEFAAGLVANPHQQSGVKESAGFGVASSSNSLDEADLTISSTSISSGLVTNSIIFC